MKKILVTLSAVALLAGTGAALAQQTTEPANNINGRVHPNLHRAQLMVDQAYNTIAMAQRNNEFDFGGHAQHAKELLDQASKELRAAATYENDHPPASR